MQLRMHSAAAASVVPALLLAACSGGGDPPAVASGNGQQLRMETYCAVAGLEPALRQTFIVVDQRSLKPAQKAEDFAQQNASVRDAVMAFAEPTSALESGRSAPRERITLMLAPTDGSSPRLVFSGCLPGLSQTERTAQSQGESKVSSFFTGGMAQELGDDTNTFRATVAGALIQAARSATPAVQSDKDSLFGSLAATGQVFRSAETVPRIVLVSDHLPASSAPDVAQARTTAFSDAGQTSVDFGNAEVVVLGQGGNNDIARAYLQAYLLRMNGKLASWSADASGVSPSPAPTTLQRFSGTAMYPGGSDEIVHIRLGTDASGKLVNSWLILTGVPFDRATPLSGQAICDDVGNCKFRSDHEGFAQVWVAQRGEEVQFDNQAPFGGMREWAVETKGKTLKGEIFDSAVSQVGPTAGQKSIGIKAILQQKANF